MWKNSTHSRIYQTALCTFFSFIIPIVLFAQAPQTFRDVISLLVSILQALVPIIFGLVLVWILWSASQTILHADSPEKRREGKMTLLWGVIVLAIMVSVWGLISILRNTFGV